jgi:hypothetical protein
MAARIFWNNARDTMTSAIWKITQRPCRTILARIFTNRSLLPDMTSLTGLART